MAVVTEDHTSLYHELYLQKMLVSAWFQKVVNQSRLTMMCCLCQLPPAELSEGERAVWAAQLLERSQLYLQEPGETWVNYKKKWWC